MTNIFEQVQFNGSWAIVLWMAVLLAPYGIWLNPPWKTLALGSAFAALVSAVGGSLALVQGNSAWDTLMLQEVPLLGRSIVVGYGLLLATVLTAMGKAICLYAFGREDRQPPYT